MKIIDVIKSFTTEEMVDFLDKYGQYDFSPWNDWFNENYCDKCMVEIDCNPYSGRYCEYTWCELHGNCKHFQDIKEVPDNKQVIKMWLETEDY